MVQPKSRFAALAAGLAVFALAHGALAADATPDDTARFIAGLPVSAESPLARFTKEDNWQRHAKFFDNAWGRLDKQQISKVRAWSEANVKAPRETLFYFFSGPDFLYANGFFPKAKTYVLAGLEPVGPIPQVDELRRRTLPAIRDALGTTLKFSFFITQEMNNRLRGQQVNGALPILYVFLSHAGKTIKEVTLVNVDKDGVLKPVEELRGRQAAGGVKIVFSGSDGAPQTLYYFSTDLSDSGVKNSGFLKFAETLAPGDGLIKSASYLLHGGNFTTVRQFLLDHVHTMVQDDSGVPVASFKADEWELSPFGAYIGPIEVFSNRPQAKMRELFAKKNNPPKLDFGIGYRWRGHDSNLLLAVKKTRKTEQ